MNTIQIETARLYIREIQEADIDFLLKIYSNSQNMEFIPNANIEWTDSMLRAKYEKANLNYNNGWGIYAVELKQSGRVIGEAGLFNSFQDLEHLELGYILDHVYWRMGLGTEICRGLIDYGFLKLNLQKLTARMFAANTASVRLSEKCGMKLTGQGITEKNEAYCEYEIENSKIKNLFS